MSLILSPQQAQAKEKIGTWLRDRDQPMFVLKGPAGSGKSSIVRQLTDQFTGPVYYLVYTGAGANILKSLGLPASTLHSQVYLPSAERELEAKQHELELAALDLEDGDERTQRKAQRIRKRLEELYSPDFVLRPINPFRKDGLIVLDECSFVAEREARDLLSFNVPVLVLGDDAQLPPVEGKGFFTNKCDFKLTEIHRQALDSPILYLATLAREGKPIKFGHYGDSVVMRAKDLTDADYLGVEQVLCGTNKTRLALIAKLRDLKGFTGIYPKATERLVCKRNNKLRGIFNGEIFKTVTDTDFSGKFAVVDLEDRGELNVHKECFTEPDLLKSWSYEKRKKAEEFTYADCLTIHSAQGSQYKSVLIIPDLFRWSSAWEDYKRLTYTALTRGIDRVILAL